MHTNGTSFDTRWVTVNPADSTAGAKAAHATPFKRPENGVFRPGTGFKEFYFTETGDTNKDSDLPGAFGGVFRLQQAGPSADRGRLSLVANGDVSHTGLDNIQFATKDQLLVVEDAGDTLHAQRNALDSGYVLTLNGDDRKAPEFGPLACGGTGLLGDVGRAVPAQTTATTATTRSPASTSPTVTRPSAASWAPSCPRRSTGSGGPSGPSSTATT